MFWPSSRRLAISPPHERATSSGCGATKTWVMGGEYTGGSGAPARLAEQRDEDAGAVRALDPLVAVPRDHEQLLGPSAADRDHQAAPVAQLVPERLRDGGC